MAPNKIVGFGHSHLSCLFRAHRTGGFDDLEAYWGRLNTKSFQPNFETVGAEEVKKAAAGERVSGGIGRLVNRLRGKRVHPATDSHGRSRALTSDLERRLRHVLRREKPQAILLACMGNEYNTLGMLRHPQPFDFDIPGVDLDRDLDADKIPYPMMKAQLRQLAEMNVLLFWRFFNEISEAPIYVVPPPPPIADEKHILSYPGNFAGRAKTYGVSPAPFRRKMWLLYCEVLREAVEGTNTTFVDLPDVIFDGGYLAKQFWQEDPTHGNIDYGRVMLTHVKDMAFAS